MTTQQVDVVIIGGGPAGYVAAIRAAQLGGNTVLIEKDKLGGVCLNVGCIPTKAILKSCEILSFVQKAHEFGLEVGESKIDINQLMARKHRIVNRLVGGVGYLLKKNKVQWIKGRGETIDSSTVHVQGEEEFRIKTKNIIIATGSFPATLPLQGVDKEAILTSTEALEITEVPEHLLIVGAGAIGIEFAHIYNALGSSVAMVEMLPAILPGEDSELSETLKKIMTKRGIKIFTNSTLDSIKKQGKQYMGIIKTPQGIQETAFNKILVSIGRRPSSKNIGLDKAGVETDQKGWIKVNSHMQTTCPAIYAAGDVVGGYLLAHAAYLEGEVAAENAMGENSSINYRAVPRFVCSLPEMAAVGLSEREAQEKGYQIKVGRFPFAANGKAVICGEKEGMVKVICDAATEEILGMHILGHQATDLILEGTLAINLESTIQELISTIHPHPALGEVLKEAALNALGQAIHI